MTENTTITNLETYASLFNQRGGSEKAKAWFYQGLTHAERISLTEYYMNLNKIITDNLYKLRKCGHLVEDSDDTISDIATNLTLLGQKGLEMTQLDIDGVSVGVCFDDYSVECYPNMIFYDPQKLFFPLYRHSSYTFSLKDFLSQKISKVHQRSHIISTLFNRNKINLFLYP